MQRLACLGVTGVMRTTPTCPGMAIEDILGLEPLHLNVEAQARRASIWLNDWGKWNSLAGVPGHARIWEETVKSNPLLARKDAIITVLIAAKRYQVIRVTMTGTKT